MFTVVLCPGTSEGSTGSGSGFKASQKTGQRLKVSSDRLGEVGNRTCDPWFALLYLPMSHIKDARLIWVPGLILWTQLNWAMLCLNMQICY